MTNEEAKAFLDNLKICINEHPIVADWLVEIADRKTEPIPHEDYVEWGNDHIKRNACTLELFDSDGVYIEPQTERSE